MIAYPVNSVIDWARPFKLLFAAALLLAALVGSASAQSNVTLGWNASTDPTVVGYRLYSGGASQVYTNSIDVGNLTSFTVANLPAGSTNFFALTAYNANGLESPFSNEISYTVPVTNPPPSNPPTVALTSPLPGASYAAPATLNLSASVVTNGHTISQVNFFNGATVLGTASLPPYTLTWTCTNAGTYSLTAQAVYDAGSTVVSSPVSITVSNAPAGLPAPWQTVDIGSVGMAGSATASAGIFTVQGAGTIGSSSDSFRFVYQALSGDGEIRAQISSSQALANDWAGVMIRESLTAGSRYGLMGLLSGSTVNFCVRTSTGGSTRTGTGGTGTPPNIWVRLVRSGKYLYGYKSTDGVNWGTAVSRYNVSMASNIYIGLAVASGTSSALNTAVFSSLTVVP